MQYYIHTVTLGLLSLFYLTMQTKKFKDNLVWRTDQRLIGQKQLLEEHTKAIEQINKTIAELKELKEVLQGVQQ